MRVHTLLLVLTLLCGCCSEDEGYREPPPAPPDPSAISAQTKSLGPAEFIPTIEIEGAELNVIMRVTYPNPMNMNRKGDFDIPSIVDLEILDSGGQSLASTTRTVFHGGAGSMAIHGRITRTFDLPNNLADIKQLRLHFDEIQLMWNIYPKLIGGFDLRPASPPSQAIRPNDVS
jgi:hypothetical protein